MITHALPLDFVRGQKELLAITEEFCKNELAEPVSLSELANAWVVFNFDKDWKPLRATGLGVVVFKPDVPLFRILDAKSGKVLHDRMMAFAADRGFAWGEAFVYISSKEAPEQKCPGQEEWLKSVGAVPADRFSLTVR